jgi:hypothetical protein
MAVLVGIDDGELADTDDDGLEGACEGAFVGVPGGD